MDAMDLFNQMLKMVRLEAQQDVMSVGNILDVLDMLEDYTPIIMDGLNNVGLNGYWFSDRGYYSMLALGYNNYSVEYSTVGLMKKTLNEALEDGSMEGWKGGTYKIDKTTSVVIASEYGCSSNHHITSLKYDKENKVLRILFKELED